MRVALVHSTGTLWLAGNPSLDERAHPSASGLEFSGSIGVQTDRRVRAAAATHTARGNLETTVSFATSRLFDTPAEAEIWSALYDTDQPHEGELSLCGVDGEATSYVFMAGCVVEPPSRRVFGCTVMLRYTVRGGAIEEYGPASVTLDPTGSNNAILLTMIEAGAAGNAYTAAIAAPVAGVATTAAVVANNIVITTVTHANIHVTGTLTDGVDPVVVPDIPYKGMLNSKAEFETADTDTYVYWTGAHFRLGALAGSAEWRATADVATPDLVPTGDWHAIDNPTAWKPFGSTTGTPVVTALASSAAQGIAACVANAGVAALVTAANAPGNDGSGTLAAVTVIPFTGGTGQIP